MERHGAIWFGGQHSILIFSLNKIKISTINYIDKLVHNIEAYCDVHGSSSLKNGCHCVGTLSMCRPALGPHDVPGTICRVSNLVSTCRRRNCRFDF